MRLIGSDKCRRESECLNFDEYMQLIKEFSAKRSRQYSTEVDGKPLIHDTVILTSESKQVLQSRLAYSPKNESFPFEFIVNENDVAQGTGNPASRKYHMVGADHVMMSSLIAIKMQLYSESFIFNTCSSFHSLMGHFVDSGCGMANYFESLKQNDNPKFRLLCGWDAAYRRKYRNKPKEPILTEGES